MRAVVVREPGGPEVLGWEEVPDPVCGAGEVVVDVVASAVNRADLLQRQGFYPPPPGASDVLGLECSGIVSEVGDGVTGWTVGDEVCALLAGGGYAERVAVPAGQLLPRPAGVELVTAAALPEVTCTVWSNVFMLARLGRGDSFLVHGGSSGIGTMAIQLAARAGARVFTTAGTAAKLAFCRELGAEVLVNYREEDFAERVQEETGGRGVDVVLDNMGAKYLSRNLASLAVGGRLVIIGMQGGTTTDIDLNALMRRRLTVHATTLRSRPPGGPGGKAEIVAAVRHDVWPDVERGVVRPVVDRRLPMSRAADAHRAVEASEHIGKVLLVPDGS
jgi:putative PIG3 family NAD(P)H quinone oxidoreductase